MKVTNRKEIIWTITQIVNVKKSALEALQASVRVDITPKSAFDKYAQEVSMENLLKNGMFASNKLSELKVYADTLEDDSVMPKQKLLTAIEKMEKEQQKIAQMNAQAQIMKQNAMQFLNGDPDSQSEQILDALKEQQMEEPQEAGEEEIPQE